MVAASITLIILAGAAAAFTGIETQRRRSERQLAASTAAATAFLVMQRDIQNAGYKLPSSLFALRVYDNVTAGTSLNGTGSGVVSTTSNCFDAAGGAGGIIPGTDVLELASGEAVDGVTRLEGKFTVSGACLGASSSCLVQSTTSAPFLAADTSQSFVLLTSAGTNTDPGVACLGRITPQLTNNGSSLMLSPSSFTFVGPDLTDLGSKAPAYDKCLTAGPMSAWMMTRRVRYMVCPTSSGRPGLYRQTAAWTAANPVIEFTTPPVLFQQDIEDLQVAPRVDVQRAGAAVAFASMGDCSATPGTGGREPCNANAPCYCNLIGTNPTVVAPAAGSVLESNTPGSFVNGLLIGLTGVRDDPTGSGAATARPALFNRDGAADLDANDHPVTRIRSERREVVGLPNFTVVPML